MGNQTKLTMAVCLLSISACATKSADIVPLAVSHTRYDSYDCSKLNKELNRVNESIVVNSATQDIKASNDTGAVVGGMFIWPILFFIKGDGAVATELAQAKGEAKALNYLIVDKDCS